MHHDPIKEALLGCKQSFLAVGVFSGFANLLMLVPAFFMLNVYDKAVGSNSLSTLWVLSLITLFMFIVLGALEMIRSRVLVHISSKLDRQLSPTIYEMQYGKAIADGGTGGNQPLADLNAMRQFLTSSGVIAFFDIPWLPLYIGILFLFHPLLGWMGFAAASFLLILLLLNQRATHGPLTTANSLASKLNSDNNSQLTNVEVAASMGMMAVLKTNWRKRQDDVLALQETASKAAGIYGAIIKTTRIAVQSAAIAAGAYLVLMQEISPGMIIAGSILIGRALQPVEQLLSCWRGFQEARSQHSRLLTLAERFPVRSDQFSLPPITAEITATEADINPPSADKPVVMDATFTIPSGSVTFIIGPSGAGKSTLIRAILGIWPTTDGHIRIDSADASSYKRSEIGPQIGYLPQAIELFDGTVAQNIARFEAASDESVVEAAKDAGVHELILALPEGYDTNLGLQQALLSPGQRQRVALARAVFRRPKLIVLDEPNSNLDEAGDQALAKAIGILKENGSTIVVVSHRKELMQLADRVVLMNSGRIRDSGPINEVAARLRPDVAAVSENPLGESTAPSAPSVNNTKP